MRSKLRHFALITYAVPKLRLEPYIPASRFAIPEFTVGGKPMALISAIPFVDVDFHFMHVFPWLTFRFAQTNYRAYVIDTQTQEHGVWFFGTTLGSVDRAPRDIPQSCHEQAELEAAQDDDQPLLGRAQVAPSLSLHHYLATMVCTSMHKAHPRSPSQFVTVTDRAQHRPLDAILADIAEAHVEREHADAELSRVLEALKR